MSAVAALDRGGGRCTETRWADPRTASAEWTPPSWEEIVRDHSARVYRLAYRLTGNPHDAEDLTQDVFVRVFRSLHRFQPGTFEGWLHRITTNLFLDGARRRQKIRFDGLRRRRGRAAAEQAADPVGGTTPTPTSTTTSRPPWPRCRRSSAPRSCSATSRVCPTRRSPRRSDVKLGTVRSRIHRGRAQLRAALEHRRAGRRPADVEISDGEGPP